MNNTYFDIEKDEQFHYFCQGCLVGKEQISKRDIRYCLSCQPLVEREYEQLRQKYKPILYNHQNLPEDPLFSADKEIYTGEKYTKLSTLNSLSPTVDIFRPRGRPKAYKKLPLPDEEIKKLHKDGMGAKAIATMLKTEQGIEVSYKTIQRLLSGERG